MLSMKTLSPGPHLLCELVSTSLSLVSSSMASLLVLLLSAGSSAHSLVLLLWSQPNDGPQRQLLPVLLLRSRTVWLSHES